MKIELLNLILISSNKDKYEKFLLFCELKEKGLRKQSFKVLNEFIQNLKNCDFDVQKEFTIWLFDFVENSYYLYNHHVLVHQLETEILKPILEKWMEISNDDSRPYKWYAMYLNIENKMTYLKRALEIGGDSEQKVLKSIIDIYLDRLWYSFHHISEDLYLGDYDINEEQLSQVSELVKRISEKEIELQIKNANEYYRNLLDDWKSFKKENDSGFMNWCYEKGKDYEWVKSYYYKNR